MSGGRLFVLITLTGCGPSQPPAEVDLAWRQLAPGIRVAEALAPTPGTPTTTWIYAPDTIPGPLPVVLIAASGGTMFTGTWLTEASRRQHTPYVPGGFLVVAYETAGPISEKPTDQEVYSGATRFRDAQGGVVNGRAALDFALHNVPFADPSRIYAVGHSSAGTLALQLAAADERIAGVVAYAPVCDVLRRVEPWIVDALDAGLPGYRDWLARTSPSAAPERLGNTPVLLFIADDDIRAPACATYAAALGARDPALSYMTVPTGGHAQPAFDFGIPTGVSWLHTQAKRAP